MIKKGLKRLITLMLAASLVFSMAACGQKPAAQQEAQQTESEASVAAEETAVKPEESKAEPAVEETKLDKIKKAGKITVGTSADYPPYEFHKAIDGKDEIVGFDISIAKEIAKDLGVELVIQDMKFDGLLPALTTGNIDFVIAGMTPNEERKQSVDFTNIYYTASQGVMVRAEDKDKYATIESLNGKKVGAQKGAIQENIAKEQITGAKVISLGKIPDLVMELKSKKVDALVVELPVASGYVERNKDLVISDIKVKDDTGGSAIALQKGSQELVDAMNKTLDRLINEKLIEKFVAEANEAVEAE